MKGIDVGLRILLPLVLAFLPYVQPGSALAKIDCGATTNTRSDLPRTVAIASNLPGTGAHAMASGLAAVASKVTPIATKVQPYNGPNAWMPLLESGEVEFGFINILDAQMAATGTGNYKKAYPTIRIASGGVFPFTGSIMVRDKSDIKRPSDLKGKRMAWDFGGHAITQTWQSAAMEVSGLKPSDVLQMRFSNLNEAIRAVPEGKVDATFDVIGYALHVASSTKVNDRTVFTLVKAWWDNLAELQTIHPQFKRWTKDTQAITNFTVPYHSGATKFYKEAGVWSAKHDARRKEICG